MPMLAAAAPATGDMETETQSVVTAATQFLGTLDADQRAKVLFSFTPQEKATVAKFARNGPPPEDFKDGPPKGPPPGLPKGVKPPGGPGMGLFPGFSGEKYGDAVWSNFPVSDVPRPGLQLGSLTAPQRAAAMHLLQILLSPNGYRKTLDIMGADQALAESDKHFSAGRDVYTIGMFGTPDTHTPWMLEFGGHHLALNIVIAQDNGVMTPTLTGAQPAVYSENGKPVRVLAGENDKAFDLLDSLDEIQRKEAILPYEVGDLVLGPGHDGEMIVPEGLSAAAMTPRQRALLLDVISEWAGIVNDAYAKPRMAEIEADLAQTWFAWSGPTTHAPDRNGSSYYRIQGPKLLIEFAPQGVGGDLTMHVHTIYRDPPTSMATPSPSPKAPAPALAHRLDEYLQAATIEVESDRVAIELRLTPGIDHDCTVSEAERQAYAGHVQRHLSLILDGRSAALRLVSASFSPEQAIRDGIGGMALSLKTALPAGPDSHELTFENHHDSAISVYLVNALQPRDSEIAITGQERSRDQSVYRLRFSLAGAARPSTGDNGRASVETFFVHGVRHILTGYDPLLFVAALVLGAATLWDLVKVVTAFTVAHSITLTLAALDLVHLPSAVVERLISASIVCVAVQNIVSPGTAQGWTRLAVAFFFGLFHGLGFAGGLLDLMQQMPKETILLAIFGFSLGVEAGNQMVLLPLFGLLKAAPLSRSLQCAGSAAISAAGVYYLHLSLVTSPAP